MNAVPSIDKMLECFSAVVVTGGSSGIGKSFIEHMGRVRPSLRFCNLSRTKPTLIDSQLNVRHVPCNLSVRGEFPLVVAEVLAFLQNEVPEGKVLLINNAGFGGYGHFPDPSPEGLSDMLDVNIGAVVRLTAGLMPVLKGRGGAIVNVASTAAFQPTPYLATYGATKAFVLHWSLSLNEELRGSDVFALAVCPGPTETDFFRRAGFEGGKAAGGMQSSDAVVRESLQALAAGRALVVTGWKNRLMTFVSSKLPKTWSARLARVVLARTRLRKAGP